MLRSVFTCIVLRGSNPKLLCKDRIMPRTATSDDVTSTAHTAICNARRRSRRLRCRIPANVFVPALMPW
jgi:hypothetical protein